MHWRRVGSLQYALLKPFPKPIGQVELLRPLRILLQENLELVFAQLQVRYADHTIDLI